MYDSWLNRKGNEMPQHPHDKQNKQHLKYAFERVCRSTKQSQLHGYQQVLVYRWWHLQLVRIVFSSCWFCFGQPSKKQEKYSQLCLLCFTHESKHKLSFLFSRLMNFDNLLTVCWTMHGYCKEKLHADIYHSPVSEHAQSIVNFVIHILLRRRHGWSATNKGNTR